MNTDFQSHRVLITAGASGIGRCIAEAFLNRGASVHIADIDDAAIQTMQLQYPSLTASCVDVADPVAVDELFRAQQQTYGGLDHLVNCAGIKGPTALLENTAVDEWRRCLAVNLEATFLCCRQAVPLLRRSMANSTRPAIVNISSTAGWHGYPMRSAYSSAKWAVIGLTKSLAMELGEAGIRVNVICPGTVEGERMSRVVADEARESGANENDLLDGYRQACSLRELIRASDVADMALFLCSSAASRVTGQIMNVDGHMERFTA